jgi:predicted enzyme related to lactoylglutathione lyase
MAVELVNWLEIPVLDMERARRFYEAVLDCKIVDMEVGDEIYPCIPNKNDDGFSGALVQYDFRKPGNDGPLVYLTASPDVETMVKRILEAGGSIIKERTEIAPGFGFFSMFRDSEGNTLAIQGDK